MRRKIRDGNLRRKIDTKNGQKTQKIDKFELKKVSSV